MADRFVATTQRLRSTAARLLVEQGTRAFAMEGVARAADMSVGALYERWDGREDMIADVFVVELLPRVHALFHADIDAPLAERLRSILDSPIGREVLVIVAESVFAGRDYPALAPLSRDFVGTIENTVGSGADGVKSAGARWWLTTLCVGVGVLEMGGIEIPNISDPAARVVSSSRAKSSRRPKKSEGVEPIVPASAVMGDQDETARRIENSARELLSTRGDAGFTIRRIAEAAGVSMSSLYRRYGSRTELIYRVLLTDLNEARFSWSNELLDVLAHPDPPSRAADTFLAVLKRVYENPHDAHRLLEVTVAARTDPDLLALVAGQIGSAVDARTDLIRRLGEAGVVDERISASALAWFIQALPIGVRLLSSIGIVPEPETARDGFAAICGACLVTT